MKTKANKWTYPVLLILSVLYLVYWSNVLAYTTIGFFNVISIFFPVLFPVATLILIARNRKTAAYVTGIIYLLYSIYSFFYMVSSVDIGWALLNLLLAVLPGLVLFGVIKNRKVPSIILFCSGLILGISTFLLMLPNLLSLMSVQYLLSTLLNCTFLALPHFILSVAMICPFQFSRKQESTESDSYLESYKKQHHY